MRFDSVTIIGLDTSAQRRQYRRLMRKNKGELVEIGLEIGLDLDPAYSKAEMVAEIVDMRAALAEMENSQAE